MEIAREGRAAGHAVRGEVVDEDVDPVEPPGHLRVGQGLHRDEPERPAVRVENLLALRAESVPYVIIRELELEAYHLGRLDVDGAIIVGNPYVAVGPEGAEDELLLPEGAHLDVVLDPELLGRLALREAQLGGRAVDVRAGHARRERGAGIGDAPGREPHGGVRYLPLLLGDLGPARAVVGKDGERVVGGSAGDGRDVLLAGRGHVPCGGIRFEKIDMLPGGKR